MEATGRSPRACRLLVATKTHFSDRREVSAEEGAAFVEQRRM
jgi:hypothetical protein